MGSDENQPETWHEPTVKRSQNSDTTAYPLDDPFLGRQLGRCRLLRQLGIGGMGVVYLADHLTLEVPVAVKILPHTMAVRPEAHERFLREARAAARISHANVVRVLDAAFEAGTAFLVMEYVEGRSVAELLESGGRLPIHQAVRIAAEAAKGLAAAHDLGLVHRDVKPANLMLTEGGQVKVADFGLVREPESSLSSSEHMMGTPGFMSPEQANSQELDARSDQFSLGVTLFCMLTGVSPFKRDSAMASVLACSQDRLPSASKLNPEVPLALERVVGRMCRKQTARRYPHMRAVAEALEQSLDEPASPPRGSHAFQLLAGALLLVVAFGVGLWVRGRSSTPVGAPPVGEARPRPRIEPEKRPAGAPTEQGPPALELAERVLRLGEAGKLEEARALLTRRTARPDGAGHGARQGLKEARKVLANFYCLRGTAALEREAWEDARRAFAIATELDPNDATAWESLGQALARLRKPEEARRAVARAIAIEPRNAEHLNVMGQVLGQLGEFAEAVKVLRKAIGLQPNNWEHWNDLHFALSDLGRRKEAIAALKKAITLAPAAELPELRQTLEELEND